MQEQTFVCGFDTNRIQSLAHRLNEMGYPTSILGRPQKALLPKNVDPGLIVLDSTGGDPEDQERDTTGLAERTGCSVLLLSAEVPPWLPWGPGAKIQSLPGTPTDADLQAKIQSMLRCDASDPDEEPLSIWMAGLLQEIPLAFLIVGPGREIRHASRAAEALLGSSMETLRHGPWTQHLVFVADERLPDGIPRTLESALEVKQGRFERDVRLIGAQGQTVALHVVARNLTGADGLVTGSLFLLIDVATMASRPRGESADPRADVGLLAAGVGHQLNNALQVMMGHADLLSAGLASPKAMESALAMIMRTSDQASQLVEKLIRFSRFRPVMAQVIDPAQRIGGLSEELKGLMPESIELVMNLPGPSCPVEIDAEDFDRVIRCLVENSRDAIKDRGRITLDVRCGEFGPARAGGQGPSAAASIVEVTDTGCGMDPEVRAHMFEPFFTTKDSSDRTGIGLTTIYEIVRRSGGKIEIETQIGDGTTFRLFFPVAVARSPDVGRDPSRSPSPATQDEKAPEVVGGTESILIVDDEPVVLKVLEKQLRALGYGVTCANSGMEALETLGNETQTFDLLITDIVMPVMDGLELIGRVETDRPDLPVICISGYRDERLEGWMARRPRTGYLPKPFTTLMLGSLVRRLLG